MSRTVAYPGTASAESMVPFSTPWILRDPAGAHPVAALLLYVT